MNPELCIWLLVLIPAAAGLLALAMPSVRLALGVLCAGVLLAMIPGI